MHGEQAISVGLTKRWTFLAVGAALVAASTGCGDDGGGSGDPDAGTRDAGPEVEVDSGPSTTGTCWGDPCSSEAAAITECPGSPAAARFCIEQTETSFITGGPDIGDPNDEPLRTSEQLDRDLAVEELPGGAITEVFAWSGGYCTTQGVVEEEGCSTNEDCTLGPSCEGRCLAAFGEDDDGNTLTGCFAVCDPAGDGNDVCGDFYACRPDIAEGTCWAGCTNDLECRVAREDTNGDGFIDPFDFLTNTDGDRLVLDLESAAFCDDNSRDGTFRCINPGVDGVDPGAPCSRSSQCMENGTCILEEPAAGSTAPRFTDGYCVVQDCLSDAECGEAGICQTKGFGNNACLKRCDFAAEIEDDGTFGDGAFGLDGGHPDCRPGYKCEWIGELDDEGAVRTDGGCLPGVYTAIEEPNLGEICTRDSDCWSPLGNGTCRRFVAARNAAGQVTEVRGYCTVDDCRPSDFDLTVFLDEDQEPEDAVAIAPGIPENDVYCGPSATCIPLGGDIVDGVPPATTQCFKLCETAEDCGAGFACNDTFGFSEDLGSGICWIDCINRNDPNGDEMITTDDADDSLCRTGEVCSENGGVCRPE